jgi:hypothetical protein
MIANKWGLHYIDSRLVRITCCLLDIGYAHLYGIVEAMNDFLQIMPILAKFRHPTKNESSHHLVTTIHQISKHHFQHD